MRFSGGDGRNGSGGGGTFSKKKSNTHKHTLFSAPSLKKFSSRRTNIMNGIYFLTHIIMPIVDYELYLER